MKRNITEGFWVNEFLILLDGKEFDHQQITRKVIASLMKADYTSVDGWMNLRNRISQDKVENLIHNMGPAMFRFWLDYQAAMRSGPNPAKSVEAERAEMSGAQAAFDAAYAKAVSDGKGIDQFERTELLCAGSVLTAETAQFVQAIVA